MKGKLARFFLLGSVLTLLFSSILLALKTDPFHTHFYLFAWWSYIVFADSWLYLKGGDSLLIDQPLEFVAFLLPFSAFLWFLFEAFNLRIQNWQYIDVPGEIWIRWPGNFLAFGTVLPGIFLTANLLEHYGLFRKNEFSQFFPMELSKNSFVTLTALGGMMLLLPLLFPRYFFPLVWGGFILLLDPFNAVKNRKSLVQEWSQKNWNRTYQLLTAGMICGGLWEFWNYWAGAKWIYTVPLPVALMNKLKIFEMPLLGFLGFPPFALECFVMTQFALNVREQTSKPVWNLLRLGGLIFSLAMCYFIDVHTVKSFK